MKLKPTGETIASHGDVMTGKSAKPTHQGGVWRQALENCGCQIPVALPAENKPSVS